MELGQAVVNAALVGTARSPGPLPPTDGPLGEALSALGAASPETRLLQTAAVMNNFLRCGRTSSGAVKTFPLAEADTRPAAPAADILSRLLSTADNQTTQHLLLEWFTLASRAGNSVPHRLLPAVMDYVARHAAVRPLVLPLLDSRGQWLGRLNPAWAFALPAAEEHDWHTATRAQRLQLVTSLRQNDPARARSLVQTTWDADPVGDRVAFLEQFRTNLSDADEPWLESLLDAPGRQLPAAAVDLLSRLPNSRLVQRMIARTQDRLIFKTGPQPLIDIDLPDREPDPASKRDGITASEPPDWFGPRQWKLVQALSCVPAQVWSTRWNQPPQSCVQIAAAGEHRRLLYEGWSAATQQFPDPMWAAALLHWSLCDEEFPMHAELLTSLPLTSRSSLLDELLGSDDVSDDMAVTLVMQAGVTLTERASAAMMQRAERLAADPPQRGTLARLLATLAEHLSPVLYPTLAATWTEGAWQPHRRLLDPFFSTLAIRAQMHQEFST